MTRFQAELCSENTALTRRRYPLSAAPVRSELPDSIRRPAQGAAGRGHPHNQSWPGWYAKEVMTDIEVQRREAKGG